VSIFAAPSFYNQRDRDIYESGYFFQPREPFSDGKYTPPVLPDEETATSMMSATAMSPGRDDNRLSYDQVTPKFTRRGVFADAEEYGPGGTYEINPSALGFEFGPQGQVMRAGPMDYMQGQLAASSTNPQILGSNLDLGINRVAGISLRDIADAYDERMQNVPGQDFRNFLKNFLGAGSNYEAARVKGQIANMPGLSGILANIGGRGNRSDTSRFAVDDAGYGVGTQRDQFGVFTGGKTLFGKTKNYEERMRNEIGEIAKSFGLDEDDLLGLDPTALNELAQRNKFRQTQVIDYVNKLRIKDIENKYQKAVNEKRKADIKNLQTRIDRGDFGGGRDDPPDRNRGSVTKESAARTSGVGGGGYTRSDSARESRRGGQYGFMGGGLVDLVDIYD